MNHLSERKDQITGFWDLENEEERDKLIAEIRSYAATQEPEAFSREARALFEQANFSGISVIYEALTADPDKWATFFKEEYKRAFQSAETAENAWDILECLEEIGAVHTFPATESREIVSLLSHYLSSHQDVLRYKAVWLLGDWIDQKNAGRHANVISLLEKRLDDPNWKIRMITKGVLEDMGQLPAGYAVRLMDRLRATFSSPYQM